VANLVYFSSVSGNTKRFVDKLGVVAERIPIHANEESLVVSEDFILITPTYGGGPETKAVPKQVIKFINNPQNRKHLRGVIGAGNTNFGDAYAIAGDIIAAKCAVPVLYRFEVFGTKYDVDVTQKGLIDFWNGELDLS
jgi:protein involved in ribonucleotide reduction